MIITFDLGNSDLVLGAFENDSLIALMRTHADRFKSVDEYANTIKELLFSRNIEISAVKGTIISSVVPELTRVLRGAIKRLFAIEPIILAAGVKTGLKIQTDNPSEVGTDLISDSVGAIIKYGYPCIIADLGTASKIILINKDGAFAGCLIFPGVKLASDALISIASQLPTITLTLPKKVVGTNTPDSMNSGIINGNASMIDGIVQRIEEEIGYKCKHVLTGGLSKTIYPACREEYVLDRELCLNGLYSIWKRNSLEVKNNA